MQCRDTVCVRRNHRARSHWRAMAAMTLRARDVIPRIWRCASPPLPATRRGRRAGAGPLFGRLNRRDYRLDTHHSPAAMTSVQPSLLKKTEVCTRLVLSLRTLESMVKAGTFPPPVRMGKHVYWSEAAIAAWMSRMFGPQEAWRPNR